jgi:ornithine carbamoyltransferase
MLPTPPLQRSLWSLDRLSSDDLSALFDAARRLHHAAEAGQSEQPLRGKNIALMCEQDDSPGARAFAAAARRLGAHVAHIRPSRSQIGPGAALPGTASVLGRLYDAIACEGLPPDLVQAVARGAGRPVIDGLTGTGGNPALADTLPPPVDLNYLLQAVLCSAMA